MFCRARLKEDFSFSGEIDILGHQATQSLHIRLELRVRAFRDLADRLVQRKIRVIPGRAFIDLVIHIRDVAGVDDILRAVDVPQQAEQHVEHDHRARIPDMGEIINRGAADIHAHAGRIERSEGFLLPRQRVVEPQLSRHVPSPGQPKTSLQQAPPALASCS